MSIVLIISNKSDLHALAVRERIREIGRGSAECEIVDFATFPIASRASVKITGDGCTHFSMRPVDALPEPWSSNARNDLRSRTPRPLNLDDLRSIWWRRPRRPIPPEYSSAVLRDFAVQNTTEFLLAFFSELGNRSLLINDPFREGEADKKLVQLHTAIACGLKVPETLVTNCAADAEAFVSGLLKVNRKVVYKQIASEPMQVNHLTQDVHETDVPNIIRLMCVPGVFQEKILGGYDVRVALIGTTKFAMAQQARACDTSDVRKEKDVNSWEVGVPDSINDSIQRLQSRLGLRFGLYDFKVDKREQWHFLEVNPSGQWLFMEMNAGIPLSEAFAHYLLDGTVGEEFRVSARPAYTRETLKKLLSPVADIIARAEAMPPTASVNLSGLTAP
jgi:hypothetical protein